MTVYILAGALAGALVLLGMQRQNVNDLRRALAGQWNDLDVAEHRIAVLEDREEQVREFLTSPLVGFDDAIVRDLDLWLWSQTLTDAEQAAQEGAVVPSRRPQKLNDKTFSHRNVPSDRLREQALRKRGPSGTYGMVVPPDVEWIRRAIDAQLCPFCGKGPFKMLPVHTNKKHGVDKWELRERAGYSTKDPLCSEEARQKMRDAYDPASNALARATQAARGKRKPQRWTSAGIAKNAAAIKAWMDAHPEEAREAAKKASGIRTPEGEARRLAAVRAWHEANPRAFIERLHSPESRAKARASRQERFVVPDHGTVARYKHGCRCEPCRQAKATYRKQLEGKP